MTMPTCKGLTDDVMLLRCVTTCGVFKPDLVDPSEYRLKEYLKTHKEAQVTIDGRDYYVSLWPERKVYKD